MARLLAAETKIRGGRHDPAAKVVLPDAIGDHPGGQRMIGPRDPRPPAPSRPLASLGTTSARSPVEEAKPRHSPRNDVTRTPGIAAPLDRRVLGLALGHGIGGGKIRRNPHAVQLFPLGCNASSLGSARLPFALEEGPAFPSRSAIVAVQGPETIVLGLDPGLNLLRRSSRHEVHPRELLGDQFLGPGIRKRCAGEDPIERVIVALRHRVELVIVAAGTPEGHPEEGAARGVDGVFERQMPQLIGRRGVAAREGQKPGGDDLLGRLLGRALARDDVSGKLLADELIKRLIGIE